VAGKNPERVGHRLEWLVASDRASRRNAAFLQESNRDRHALLCLLPFPGLVIREEVKMGDAYRDNKVHGNVAVKACEDLIAEGGLAAMRVGDYEKPLPCVASGSGSLRTDARALKGKWGQGAQAKNDDRNDREPHPT
jgi:hypothetical protein